MFGHDFLAEGSATLLMPPVDRRADPADLAERALRSGPYLALRNITCEWQDGVLTLRGCLPTYYLKQVAQAVVARIESVQQVINEIEVLCAGMREVRRA
jgi:osmotically-inducible protein OsmY